MTLKLRPRNAFALGGLAHARGVIPEGLGPLHGSGQIAGRRQVGPNSPAHTIHGMATDAAFAGKEFVPTRRIARFIHVAGHVKVGEQLGDVVVTERGIGNPVGVHAFPHAGRVIPHGRDELGQIRLSGPFAAEVGPHFAALAIYRVASHTPFVAEHHAALLGAALQKSGPAFARPPALGNDGSGEGKDSDRSQKRPHHQRKRQASNRNPG